MKDKRAKISTNLGHKVFNKFTWAIFVLVSVCGISFMAIPDENLNIFRWLVLFFVSKTIALVSFALVCFFYSRWSKQGKLDGLNDFLKE